MAIPSLGEIFGVIINVVVILWLGPKIIGLFRKGSVSSCSFVASEYDIDQKKGGGYVRVVGRDSGGKNWILSMLGILSTYTLEISDAGVLFEEKSNSQIVRRMIPRTKIGSFGGSYKRPFKLLVIAIIVLIAGVLTGLILRENNGYRDSDTPADLLIYASIITACVLGVIYALNKTVSLDIRADNNETISIQLARSVIENTDVNMEKINQTLDVLMALDHFSAGSGNGQRLQTSRLESSLISDDGFGDKVRELKKAADTRDKSAFNRLISELSDDYYLMDESERQLVNSRYPKLVRRLTII